MLFCTLIEMTYQKLVEVCQRIGFYPEVVHKANNIHAILRFVEVV
jgi:hypothetical protein